MRGVYIKLYENVLVKLSNCKVHNMLHTFTMNALHSAGKTVLNFTSDKF